MVGNVRDLANHLKMDVERNELTGWQVRLQDMSESLEEPVENYNESKFGRADVATLLAPKTIQQTIDRVISTMDMKISPATPELTAWDTLTTVKQTLQQCKSATRAHAISVRIRQHATSIYDSFELARDNVLSSLYKSIEDRFTHLYRAIHGEDEAAFESSFRPEGASLHIEVDFHGRGKHPPHALHSEGHQDTMGLCLYFALAEHLTGDLISLTILDDVIMSVDSGHRRYICDLLAKEFPKKQFLITTHDKTWERELGMNVIPRENMIEFTRWTVETGPLVEMEKELWAMIDAELDKHDVAAAAFRLRSGLEHFFETVCDKLKAEIRYRTDGRWELGEFLSAATSRYKQLLKISIASANSWGGARNI